MIIILGDFNLKTKQMVIILLPKKDYKNVEIIITPLHI